MNDESKTREQLIAELADLRRWITDREHGKTPSEGDPGHPDIAGPFRGLIEGLENTHFLYSHDTEGVFTYLSPSIIHILGYTPHEFSTHYTAYLTDNPVNDEARRHTELSIKGVPQPRYEVEVRHKDGGTRWLEVSEVPVFDARGRVVSVNGIAHDITGRKSMQQAVMDSERFLRNIIDSAPFGAHLYELTDDGRLIFTGANRAADRILSISNAQFVGKTIEEAFPPLAGTQIPDAYRNAARGIPFETEQVEYRDERISGAFEVIARQIGRNRVAVFFRDITERRKEQEKLERALARADHERSRVQAVIEAMGDGVSLQDTNFKVLYQNDIHKKLVGEHIGEYCYKAYQRRDAVCPGCHLALAFADGKVHRAETTRNTEEGTFYYEIIASPLRNEEGAIIAGIEAVRNITGRRRLEESVRESERRYRDLAETLPQTVYEADLAGRITYVNETALRMFGYTREDFARGVNVFDTLVPADRDRARKNAERVLRGEVPADREYAALRKDGSQFPVMIYSTPVMRESRPVGLRGIVVDMTDTKRYEAEMVRAQKIESLGILAGGLAHDFNNILTAMLGNISLARTMVRPEERVVERLTEAERACLRARDLTQQLLTFAKGGEPIRRSTSLLELIKDLVTFILSGSPVVCELTMSNGVWPAAVDPSQISHALSNIVINAMQAMPGGGTLTISVENAGLGEHNDLGLEAGRYVRIVIRDSGPGIPADQLPKIFDPYFTTKDRGSGLGLTMTHAIITRHRGTITVDSRVGAGTTFSVYLPAADEASQPPDPEDEHAPAGKGRVLLMDDEEMIRDVASEILTRLGYEVTCTRNGEETIELYRKSMGTPQAFNVVVMDLTIPGGMGGREAIGRLREIDPAVRAIVSSGYSDDATMANYRQYGFAEVMTKPYRGIELGRVLKKVLQDR